jgi:DHA1 family bicyclomycin/chloramphenicol resistance-like MFS transporter
MTDIKADTSISSSHRPMGFPEFVVMIASIMALNPIAMDMMLPALPNIASTFHITIANRPQAVLSTFLIGFGVGQFVMGPLSDHFGRRPVLIDGMALYCIASVLAITASSFETLLLARALQGLGTSATRVIATSIVRDCYAGRRMASVMSLAMMVFIAVPVLAPSLGEVVLLLTEWRGIFIVLMFYGLFALVWSARRMPETLPITERKSLLFARCSVPFARPSPTARPWVMHWPPEACRVRYSLSCSRRSRCSPGSTDLGVTFPWHSQPSPSALPSPAFSTPVSLARSGCESFLMAR